MSKQQHGWIPELDGLRALAALAVMIDHHDNAGATWPDWSVYGAIMYVRHYAAGSVAVAFFFTLSAFLLTYLGRREVEQTGGFSIRAFYARRFFRIWPLYFTALAVSLFVYRDSTWLREHIWIWIFFLSNWTLAFLGWNGFVPQSPPILTVLWSIGVEEQFYWLFPFALVMAIRSRTRALIVLATIIVGGNLLRWAVLYMPYDMPFPPQYGWTRMYYATVTYLDTFAYGALAGWIAAGQAARWRRVLGNPLAALVVARLVYEVAKFWGWHPWYPDVLLRTWALTLTGTVFALVLLWVAANQGTWTTWLFRLPPLRLLGLLSFGIYVWHPLANELTTPYLAHLDLPDDARLTLLFGAYFAVTLALATMSYLLVERPCLRLKDRLFSRKA